MYSQDELKYFRGIKLYSTLKALEKEGQGYLPDVEAEEEEYCECEISGRFDPREFGTGARVITYDMGEDIREAFNLPYNPADSTLGLYTKLKRAGPNVMYTTWEKQPTGGPVRRIRAGEQIERIKIDDQGMPIIKESGEVETELYTVPDGGIYYNKITGQTFEKSSETKADINKYHLYETFQTIRDYINANIEPWNCKFLTLTYKPENIRWKENGVQDETQVYNDYKSFWKRFQRYCNKNNLEIPEYINIIEPQGRGAWHYHTLLFYKEKQPFIDIWELNKLWGLGIVFVKAIKDNITNYGSYFTAYFTDIPLEEIPDDKLGHYIGEPIESVKQTDGTTKKIIKGGRIRMYPVGMRLLRTSRGIKKPLVQEMTKGEALEATDNCFKTFEKIRTIRNPMGKKVNRFHKVACIDNTYYDAEKQEERKKNCKY